MTVLYGASVVTPAAVLDDGWVRIGDGGLISDVGVGRPVDSDALDLDGGYLMPAYIDVHCHGGAGSDFGSADREGITRASLFHQSHGTAGMLASLVAAPADLLCRQLARIAEVVRAGQTSILGSHLEGPFLSNHRCGAQNPAHLLEPDAGLLGKMLDAAAGTLKMITIAPELPGSEEVIDAAIAANVLVAVGHTDATYAQAMGAFQRGASVATHLFNGMRPLHHREPGPVLAAIDSYAACELINDGVHLDAAISRRVAMHDPRRFLLITDAVSATGVCDGSFTLGGQPIEVRDGEARLTSNGSLAGSTLTMDQAVRRTIAEFSVPISVAAAGASANPARLLGLAHETGSIAAGLRADLLHLNGDFQIMNMMMGGRWRGGRLGAC